MKDHDIIREIKPPIVLRGLDPTDLLLHNLLQQGLLAISLFVKYASFHCKY